MRAPLLALVAAAALAAPATATAAPGGLDLGFAAPDGYMVPDGGGRVTDVAIAPDGAALFAIDQSDGDTALRVGRVLPDGTPDGGFGGNSYPDAVATVNLRSGNTYEAATAVARQADGKVVIAGYFDLKFVLARFGTTGALDPTFNDNDPDTPAGVVVTDLPSGGGGEMIQAMAIEPDGEIVVAGNFHHNSGQARIALARYQAGGQLDVLHFNDADGATPMGTGVYDVPGGSEEVAGLALDPSDGSIVVAGTNHDGGTQMFAVRISEHGTLLQSFGGGDGVFTYRTSTEGALRDEANAVVRHASGRLVLAGVVGAAFTSGDTALVGLTPSGELDPSFGTGGVRSISPAPRDRATDLTTLPDGRLLVAGTAGADTHHPDVLVARFTAGGAPDTGFGQGGAVMRSLTANADEALALGVQPDGTAVVGGVSETTGSVLSPFVAGFEGGDPPPSGSTPAPGEPAPTTPAGSPSGPGGAPPSPAADPAPVLTAAKAIRRRGRTSLRFRLSEAATVRIVVTRGRKRVATVTRRLAAGQHTMAVRAVRRRGRYRATLVATDAAGQRSQAVRVGFRVR